MSVDSLILNAGLGRLGQVKRTVDSHWVNCFSMESPLVRTMGNGYKNFKSVH